MNSLNVSKSLNLKGDSKGQVAICCKWNGCIIPSPGGKLVTFATIKGTKHQKY